MATSTLANQLSSEVMQKGDVWLLRLPSPNGKVQEFRCATLAQAQTLALQFTGSVPHEVTPRPSRPTLVLQS